MEDTHLKAFCGYRILVACYVMKRKKNISASVFTLRANDALLCDQIRNSRF